MTEEVCCSNWRISYGVARSGHRSIIAFRMASLPSISASMRVKAKSVRAWCHAPERRGMVRSISFCFSSKVFARPEAASCTFRRSSSFASARVTFLLYTPFRTALSDKRVPVGSETGQWIPMRNWPYHAHCVLWARSPRMHRPQVWNADDTAKWPSDPEPAVHTIDSRQPQPIRSRNLTQHQTS